MQKKKQKVKGIEGNQDKERRRKIMSEPIKDMSVSWKLKAENNNDREYIVILNRHKKYGYATKTKLIAAALKEYQKTHDISENKGLMDIT